LARSVIIIGAEIVPMFGADRTASAPGRLNGD
jgi:hypothetical protein